MGEGDTAARPSLHDELERLGPIHKLWQNGALVIVFITLSGLRIPYAYLEAAPGGGRNRRR